MHGNVPELDIQRASLTTISVGQVAIGPITVGEVLLNNADFSMSAAQGVLQNVSVTVTIHVSLSWHVHVGLPWPIPDINEGDTYDLGSLGFSAAVGDITIPALNNIHIHIPSLVAQNTSVSANPVTNLQLHNATADQIRAQNVALPSAGFTIAGLALNSVQGSAISVPAAKIDQAAVGHVRGDPLSIPTVSLSHLNLPAAQIPHVSSSAPLDIPANLSPQALGFGDNDSLLSAHVTLTPSARSHIDHLEISNANASATVEQVVLHNVVLPYDVLNLTLSQVGINTIGIPAFTIS